MTRTLRNPYDVLGVASTADADEIRSAYRKLALRYHPDRNPGDAAAEERFKEISEAYATLRDPESRARYDRFGGNAYGGGGFDGGMQGRPDFSTVDWQTVFREADITIDWSARGAEYGGEVPRTGNAVFDALFGVMTGMMRNSGLLPGEDRAVALSVSVAEARAGVTRRVRVPGPSVCAQCRGTGLEAGAPCPVCGGRGVVRAGAFVEVEVPAGVRDGVKLRLKGLGGPGRPPGDAYATVTVRVPAGAELVGRDLKTPVAVTPLEASRGASIPLSDLGVTLEVPKGAVDGQTVRVAGGGLAGGDLIATLEVRVWRGLWRGVRRALLGESQGSLI